jgi:ribulose kinase
MNKIKFIIFGVALFVASIINAQPKPEQKAKKFADEMTKVLQLNKEESQAIYDIQLARFKENQEIEKNYANDPETKKEKLKELGNKVFNETKKVIGEDRQKKWKEYKSN